MLSALGETFTYLKFYGLPKVKEKRSLWKPFLPPHLELGGAGVCKCISERSDSASWKKSFAQSWNIRLLLFKPIFWPYSYNSV